MRVLNLEMEGLGRRPRGRALLTELWALGRLRDPTRHVLQQLAQSMPTPSAPPLRSFHPTAPGRAVHDPPTAGGQAWEVGKSDLTHRPFFLPPDHPPPLPHTHTRSLIPEVRAFLHPSSRGDSA